MGLFLLCCACGAVYVGCTEARKPQQGQDPVSSSGAGPLNCKAEGVLEVRLKNCW